MKDRDIYYDFVRCVCVVWIIGIWHMTNYLSEISILRKMVLNERGDDMTKIVLASFTFLSGLFLGRYKIDNRNDFFSFYKKRFQRFYILFFVSSITLYFTPFIEENFFNSLKQLFLSCVGLTCFIDKMPPTLWYMNMLLLFYLMTPFILFVKKGRHNIELYYLLSFVFLFSVISISANSKIHIVDNRILFYFPYYFLGLIIDPNTFKSLIEKHQKCTFVLIFIVIIIALYRNYYFYHLYILCGVFLLFMISFIVVKKTHSKILFNKMIAIVSYVSMVAYLFHRQIYYLLEIGEIPFCLWGIIVFFLSYYIQLSYDKILKWSTVL